MKSPLGDEARKITAEALQGTLIDLIDLSLVAKQAHWTVVGPDFRQVHLHLDEVVDVAREHTDIVAERLSAIAAPPDGRIGTVAAASKLRPFDADWVRDSDVVAALEEILGGIVERTRDRVAATETADPVTQDLLIAVADALEKQWWMWQAQAVGR